MTTAHDPDWFEIRVQGHLDSRWAPWFEGMTLELEEEGTTLLCGHVVDQAALHGLLTKVRDLGIPLVSVRSPGQDTPVPDHITATPHREATSHDDHHDHHAPDTDGGAG